MVAQEYSKVLEGQDGYLFLTNDTNRVLDQVQGRFRLHERQLWGTAMTHAARSALCAGMGARYHHILVPDRETVLSRFLPDTIVPAQEGPSPVKQYMQLGAAALLPPFYEPQILSDTSGEPHYFRRDTHWTFHGAWTYLNAAAASYGIDTSPLHALQFQDLRYDNPGDLGSKIGAPPEPGLLRVPMVPWAKPAFDNELPNIGRIRVFINETASRDERWLVLHDSFGEWLALMMPALAGTVCFIHDPDFDEVFVRNFQPTRVFFIQVERFFVRAPLNGVDYNELIAQQAKLKETVSPVFPEEIKARMFPAHAPNLSSKG